jgi:hypothetical protein
VSNSALKGTSCRKSRWLPWLAALCLVFPAGTVRADSQQTYLQCLTNFETYAESIWHTASYSGAPADAGYWGDGGSSGNGGIRGNSGVALAYAVLVIAQPTDPKTTNRLARIRQALNYDTATHVTGANNCVDGHQWGWSSSSSTDWQTPEWAGSMGLACVLVQSNLPAATVQAVRRVVASEADHRAGIAPASGHVSDTKAEENGWQGNILALAAAWMSTSNNAPTWLNAAKNYLVNTYTVANTNGDPLASWITTVTLYSSYALENHGFYHPTYEMVAGMSSGDSLLMARLANSSVATQLQPFAEHNVMAVWTNNLNGMVMNSSDFAYPAGLDWELHDYEQNSFITWMATHFNDPLARWTDGQLAQLVRYRQIVNGNGEFVGPSGGGFYREAVEARRTAIAWLHWTNANYPSGPTNGPGSAFENLTDVAIITYRGTNGFVSISYGPQTNGSSARILATIEPLVTSFPTNVYVTTPRLPGIIGLGAMGSPTAGRLVSLLTNANGFQAELQLTNGANGTTEVYFNCTGDTVGIVEVPSPASGVANSATGSFNIGIENDPLTGGSRRLEWTGGSATVTNRSGKALNVTNGWICVAGHYGVAFGPAGYLNYSAASSYNRLGAAEDTLQFMPANSLMPRYAVWFPGRNASQMATGAAQISWIVSQTNAVLTFPGAGGGLVQITAPVTTVTNPPSYPAYSLPISSITASSYQTSYPPTNAADGNYSDFWVSYGTTAGQGPTINNPEWLLVTFPRQVAVSEFQVDPRTDNGGYGPKDVQILLNGTPVYSASMGATTALDAKLTPPAYATNAELYITSSYYRGSSVNPENVQVVELVFFERAQPGTFGDWQLHYFTDAQLTNSAVGTAAADPDGDGVPNLLEFATGGNPFAADATNAAMKGFALPGNEFAVQFQERNELGNVERQFEESSDLLNWTSVTPLQVNTLQNLGTVSIYQAVFSVQPSSQFFRIRYDLTN